MTIETVEEKIKAVIAIYGQQVVDRYQVEPESAPAIKSVVESAFLSGIGTAAALLSSHGGSETVTPQAVEQLVIKLADQNGRKSQNILV